MATLGFVRVHVEFDRHVSEICDAAKRADEVLVMYRSDVVEYGSAAYVLNAPRHEYTKRLLKAVPTLTSAALPRKAPSPNIDAGTQRPLLRLVDLRKVYPTHSSLFRGGGEFVAVKGSSLTINKGQTVAVVGESGSGESTTAKLLLKVEAPTSGNIVFDSQVVTHLMGRDLFAFRRRVQPVFQNPYSSLDARYTVRESIEEPMLMHGIGDPASRRKRVDQLLDQVALPQLLAERRPAEISGGQSQRVALARALALSPDLVVLDEAISALDVLVQEQIVDLLCRLQAELGLSYLFISHDLRLFA